MSCKCGKANNATSDGDITARVVCICEATEKCKKCKTIAKHVLLSDDGSEVVEFRCVTHGYPLLEDGDVSSPTAKEEETAGPETSVVCAEIPEASSEDEDYLVNLEIEHKSDTRKLHCLKCQKVHRGMARPYVRDGLKLRSVCPKCGDSSYRIED